jgi:hypothetical protein
MPRDARDNNQSVLLPKQPKNMVPLKSSMIVRYCARHVGGKNATSPELDPVSGLGS